MVLFRNVTVRIPPYTLTSVVGKPKSGKTTFLEFLVKLKTVDEGVVQIGKRNIKQLNDMWLRSRIGFVQQKTVLFGDTIRDAIRGHHKNWSESDIVNVCRTVNVHGYIMSLQQVNKVKMTKAIRIMA